jgi:hypothetical protein
MAYYPYWPYGYYPVGYYPTSYYPTGYYPFPYAAEKTPDTVAKPPPQVFVVRHPHDVVIAACCG